jgi:hypothetical protein
MVRGYLRNDRPQPCTYRRAAARLPSIQRRSPWPVQQNRPPGNSAVIVGRQVRPSSLRHSLAIYPISSIRRIIKNSESVSSSKSNRGANHHDLVQARNYSDATRRFVDTSRRHAKIDPLSLIHFCLPLQRRICRYDIGTRRRFDRQH